MSTEPINKYDDSPSGGFSYEEKLSLVAAGNMDPKEIDLPSAEAAQGIILGKPLEEEVPKLGDFFSLEASVVPIALRARWARQDLKIVPGNPKQWEADWIEQHKDEHAVQGILRTGTVRANFGETFTNPILGFAHVMRKAADMLEAKYEEMKKTDPNPIRTRDDMMKRLADETA